MLQVGTRIESSMKRDGQGVCEIDKLLGTLDVNAVIAHQYSENNTIHCERLGGGYIRFHRFEFGCGMDKVAAAGAYHGKNGQLDLSANGAHQFDVRRNAAD
jgi:hypothetical protein